MRTRNRLLSSAAAVGVAAIFAAGALSFPASAAPSPRTGVPANAGNRASPITKLSATPMAVPSGCGAHALCLYQNSNYNAAGGTLWQYVYGSVPADTWEYVGAAANDQTSSWYNNRIWNMAIAENSPPGTGGAACYGGPEGVPDLSSYGWGNGDSLNDSISSYQLRSNATTC
jgi:hypothetical protein